MSERWGFWRWLQESRSFMAHKPAWIIYPRAALKWPAFARLQREDERRKARRLEHEAGLELDSAPSDDPYEDKATEEEWRSFLGPLYPKGEDGGMNKAPQTNSDKDDETDLTAEQLRARWQQGEPVEIVDSLEERVTALEKTVAWLLRTQDSHPAGRSSH